MNSCKRFGLLMLLCSATTSLIAQPATTSPTTAPTKSFSYKKIKQIELEMIVHFPPGWKESDKRPSIVFFFGGGWTNGTIKSFETQCSYLASRGMVAARADYRVKSRQGVTPKECVEDAKSAVRWMRQNAAKLGVDPDRIAAGGGSAGGHIAACTTLTPGLDAAGEDTTISCKANALVLYNPVLFFGPQIAQQIGNDEALAKALSPTLHLEKDSPPTLLMYGTADFLLTQGNDFMKRSKELGHKSEMFLAEGQPHGFYNKPPWRGKTTQRMVEFLESIGYLSAAKAIPFDTHDGYFVSNKFEPDASTSFVILRDQKAFDEVFGVARVMKDKARRLAPDAFETKIVVAVVKREKAVVNYKMEAVNAEAGVLAIRYVTTSKPSDTATFACPLILSIAKGDYAAVQFIEDGKVVKKIELKKAGAANITEPVSALPNPAAAFAVKCRKAEDALKVSIDGNTTIFSITSPSGIGAVTVERKTDHWPDKLTVRIHLQGLESFSIAAGDTTLRASVSSNSRTPTPLLHLSRGGKEGTQLTKDDPYWTDIQTLDAQGKPVKDRPEKGGWFEITIPHALLADQNKTIALEWIDFFRG